MSGFQAQVPCLVQEYFGAKPSGMTEHPRITQEFVPGTGWRDGGFVLGKRVSLSWLRKLRAQGVTVVALSCDSYTADFTIAEIIRYARRPLLGGRLI
jgi:hypothetical protein